MPTNQPLEEQFRERFETLEEAPPALAWNQIRKEIAPVVKAPKNKQRRFEWLAPGAIMAVISVFLLFLLKYNKALDQQPKVTVKEQALQAEDELLPEPIAEIEMLPATPETLAKTAGKPEIKVNNAAIKNLTSAKDVSAEKRYVSKLKKSDDKVNEKVVAAPALNTETAAAARMPATKVVYEITVDPQSASVKKISTAVPDSVIVQ